VVEDGEARVAEGPPPRPPRHVVARSIRREGGAGPSHARHAPAGACAPKGNKEENMDSFGTSTAISEKNQAGWRK